MKFIVKVLAEQIRQSYEIWNDERKNINKQMTAVKDIYNTMLRVTLVTNFGMISAMYTNGVISFKQFKLLDRYNDRIKALYRI